MKLMRCLSLREIHSTSGMPRSAAAVIVHMLGINCEMFSVKMNIIPRLQSAIKMLGDAFGLFR